MSTALSYRRPVAAHSTARVPHSIAVGTILRFDRHRQLPDVDFYEVVAASWSYVTLRRLAVHVARKSRWPVNEATVRPGSYDPDSLPMRKRVRVTNGRSTVVIGFEVGLLWNGKNFLISLP